MTQLVPPHGSATVLPLMVAGDALQEESKRAVALKKVPMTSREISDVFMFAMGAYTPLTGFMNVADALSVAEKMHTVDGLFWPVPVLNMVDDVSVIEGASRIALRDPNVEGEPVIAIMDVDAIEIDVHVVKGGRVVGASDPIGGFPAERPVAPGDVVATIFDSLGLDPKALLDGPGGRPFPLVDFGADPISELF